MTIEPETNAKMRRSLAIALCFWLTTEPALSQELEPRVYSASPIGTNFVVGGLTNSTGNVPLDPSLPLSDVRASINTANLSFTRTFPLAHKTAMWAIVVPYVGGNITGDVYGHSESATRNGFPGVKMRLSVNLLGPALTPSEFARRKPRTTLGVSVTVATPTGTYDPTQLINVGSNRWSFKPEVGVEVPMGKWFTDFAAGLWVFGENANYYGGTVLRQAPLATYEIDTGYSFEPGQWLALDWGYIAGGATRVGRAMPIDALSNSRYGLTYSQPIGTGVSAKVSWSHWLTGQYGQNFRTISIGLQYRWFDHP
jgi:outer membrane putative beta-barrel porin/alpha-amylase